jgi:hypothetical protein
VDIFDHIMFGDSCMGASNVWHWWNTWKMATETPSVCLEVVDQQSPWWNATSRKLICQSQKVKGDGYGNYRAARHWTQCCAGDGKYFGIRESLLPVSFVEEHKEVYIDLLSHLLWHPAEHDGFLLNITSDENWFYHFDPKTKWQRMECSYAVFP